MGTLLAWFTGYVSQRLQHVVFDGSSSSEWYTVTAAVPPEYFILNFNLFLEVHNNREYVNVHLSTEKMLGQSLCQCMES